MMNRQPGSVHLPARIRLIDKEPIPSSKGYIGTRGWEGKMQKAGNLPYWGSASRRSDFGFSADAATAFDSPHAGPHLMLVALDGDCAALPPGRVDYAPAFSTFEQGQY
jgi:hypothetical protein